VGTIDQQQLSSNSLQAVSEGISFSRAQTFTAGRSGRLDQAEVRIWKGGPLLVDASESTVHSRDPGCRRWFEAVQFASPVPVQVGSQYAIVGYTNATSGIYACTFSLSTPDPYPPRALFNSGVPPTP
jgi:hypothetical protein